MIGAHASIYARREPRTLLREAARRIAPSSILALYGLDEVGDTKARDANGQYDAQYVGTYTQGVSGVRAGDGQPAMSLPGSGGYVALPDGLRAAFSGTHGTHSIWFKVASNSVWTAATARVLLGLAADAQNTIYIRKGSSPGQVQFVHTANNVAKVITLGGLSGKLDWLHAALTWDTTTGQVRAFMDGMEVQNALTSPGTFVGTPTAALSVIGASSTSPGSVWSGSLALARIDSAALTPIQIARLALCRGMVLFDGDSRLITGPSSVPPTTLRNAGVSPLRFGWQNLAVSGQTWLQMGSDAASEIGALVQPHWRTIVIGWAGINDAAAGFGADAIWSRIQTWVAAVRALGVQTIILCTEIDAQDSVRNAVNYHDVIWPALNTLIRNGYAALGSNVVLCDLGANPNLQNALNATYFSDAAHLTTSGISEVASTLAISIAGSVA